MKFYLYALIIFLPWISGYSQENVNKIQDVIHGVTTIIKVDFKGNNSTKRFSQGTGFFFHQYKDETNLKYTNPVDSNLSKIWLITNKHVVYGEDYATSKLTPPSGLEFYIRVRSPKSNRILWDTITIKQPMLDNQIKLHSKNETDVVAIDITPFILNKVKTRDSLLVYHAVSKLNYPISEFSLINTGIEFNPGKEVLSIGYPKEFYDNFNLFPTVKAGIIASGWNLNYNGKQYFLIDGKLFPGSSGSLIISKHTSYSEGEGKNTKYFDFFVFLGVYSGELYRPKETVEFEEMTITRKETYNTGVVWYYYLIEEIINGLTVPK